MKKCRFSEEQIIEMLKQHGGWGEDGGRLHGYLGCDVLPVEAEVWRYGRERSSAAEADGGREPSSEDAGG